MSVAIIVKVNEGLVFGADSAATIQGRVERSGVAYDGVLKTYYNARKLLQIGDFPIGVLTWGTAFIGSRTVESLVREWEYDAHWQSLAGYEQRYKGSEQANFQVKECAERLREYLSQVYTEEFGEQPEQSPPITGVVVAGYSHGGFFPEIWRFVLPLDVDDQIHNLRPDQNGKPDFGAHWFGLTDAIVRLHFGRDDRVIGVVSEKFGIPEQDVIESLRPLEYQIPFTVMPLQDAIEYASYVLNVAIGRYRFAIGPELCGGQIEIAAITPQKFNWISHKPWSIGKGR